VLLDQEGAFQIQKNAELEPYFALFAVGRTLRVENFDAFDLSISRNGESDPYLTIL